MIVLLRKIAVSTFASRADSSWPPADAVMPSATARCSGARSGLGPSPGDLLQRQAQRLRVGEFAVEQAQRRLQRRQLLVRERDRREMEVLGPQRVVLLLGRPVGRPLDRQLDAQRFELRAVRVEAPRERVLVHAAVALHVAPDLQAP